MLSEEEEGMRYALISKLMVFCGLMVVQPLGCSSGSRGKGEDTEWDIGQGTDADTDNDVDTDSDIDSDEPGECQGDGDLFSCNQNLRGSPLARCS
jgi:hypothetical protein